jgi:outer membrane lipoprotein-sorting protein
MSHRGEGTPSPAACADDLSRREALLAAAAAGALAVAPDLTAAGAERDEAPPGNAVPVRRGREGLAPIGAPPTAFLIRGRCLMRCSLALALLAVGAWPAAAEENEAEKLYRAAERKVRAARTVQVRFDVNITDALGKKWDVKGSLVLGEGDKLRTEAQGRLFDAPVKYTVVSDGTSMKFIGATGQARQGEGEKPPKGLGAYFREALPRDGFFVTTLNMDRRLGGAPDAVKVSDFKLVGKERIGERNTHVIQYAVTEKGAKGPLTMKLWLDAETGLPVKLAMSGGKTDITDLTETYSEFSIDGKVDPRSFELPK